MRRLPGFIAAATIILFMDGREMRRYSRNLSLEDLERSLGHMKPGP